ncbi:NADH-quinone oxidoreductase subunit J [Streptomyces sp. NPDC059256]|uniref:NADH-quinone oxidoreductase subunit J family protein n=1 Tax=Streptomyces sp. NPDC059256 TaxID=3346794 RepID=UPI003685D2E5
MMLTATTATAKALTAAQATEAQGFLSPTGVEIAFLLVGLVTLGAAVMTVTTKQLVHAALWLVVTLGGLAVEYLLLTAEFIAWVQVLIYLGSVVVLLLFGLMLTKAPIGRSPDADSGNRLVALGVALTAAVALVWVVVDAFRATWIDLDGPPQGTTAVTGSILFRHWVLPFEALSVLLLAALIGAIVLSRKRDQEPTPKSPARPRTGPAGTPARSAGRAKAATPTAGSNASGAPGTTTAAARPAGPASAAQSATAQSATAPGPSADAMGQGTAANPGAGPASHATGPSAQPDGAPAKAPEGES